MARGRKTGGRAAGTPNRKTQEVTGLLESLGCNPIEGMAWIAMDEKHAPELRGRMFAELAQYVYPKRKSVELGLSGQLDVQYTIAQVIRERRAARLAAEAPKEAGTP